jgi:hypothetical protein
MDSNAISPAVLTDERYSPSLRSRLTFVAAVAVLLAIAVITAATIALCDGHFIYTLDDPYITLSLSANIIDGHYGLNASEPASPSSSILFPFLLAPFARLPAFDWVPLVVNSIAAAATAALFAAIFSHYSIARTTRSMCVSACLIVTGCFAVNVVGVVFTGLEHSLHILLSVATVYGLAHTLETDKPRKWLVPVIVLAPLIRFEGLALSGAAIAVLAAVGQWRRAGSALVLVMTTVAAYMFGMKLLGLPRLPSSILVKAPVLASAESIPHRIVIQLHDAVSNAINYQPAHVLWILCGFVLAHPSLRALGLVHRRMAWSREGLFVAAVLVAVVAHVIFGAWGWWFRYETYVLAIVLTAIIVLWHSEIRALVLWRSPVPIALVGGAFIYVSMPYITATQENPQASRGIYEQQYQMHRFIVDFYRQPVAVNDIGLVSYHNPNYVLDLWGLGSEEARKARMLTHTRGWMDKLTRSHNVGLVMIYRTWFGADIPPSWQRIATLYNAHSNMSNGGGNVDFYATSPSAVPDAIAALLDLRESFRAAQNIPAKIVFRVATGPVAADRLRAPTRRP